MTGEGITAAYATGDMRAGATDARKVSDDAAAVETMLRGVTLVSFMFGQVEFGDVLGTSLEQLQRDKTELTRRVKDVHQRLSDDVQRAADQGDHGTAATTRAATAPTPR